MREMNLMQDFPPNPIHKPGYRLNGTMSLKVLTSTLASGFPLFAALSSRERSAPRYSFRDGMLVLQITEDQQPWCPEFDGEVKLPVSKRDYLPDPSAADRVSSSSELD
jgi:hypothetical protein